MSKTPSDGENTAAKSTAPATAAAPVTEQITLENPIQRGGTEIATLTVRKPNSGELRGVSLAELLQMGVDPLTTVLPRISQPSLTAQEVAQMDPADLVQVGGAVTNFLLPRSAKGET
jgi:hypothetical protein